MYESLDTHKAAEVLEEVGSFSYEVALAIVEWYEDVEEDNGEPLEFDPVAIRCDWSEYDSVWDWAEDYYTNPVEEFGVDYSDYFGLEEGTPPMGLVVRDDAGDLIDEVLDKVEEELSNNTWWVRTDGNAIGVMDY